MMEWYISRPNTSCCVYPKHDFCGRRREWRDEEREGVFNDRRTREKARAQASRDRKDARKKRYEPVNERKADFRRQFDEHMVRKQR